VIIQGIFLLTGYIHSIGFGERMEDVILGVVM
jgi:hypothetical protein